MCPSFIGKLRDQILSILSTYNVHTRTRWQSTGGYNQTAWVCFPPTALFFFLQHKSLLGSSWEDVTCGALSTVWLLSSHYKRPSYVFVHGTIKDMELVWLITSIVNRPFSGEQSYFEGGELPLPKKLPVIKLRKYIVSCTNVHEVPEQALDGIPLELGGYFEFGEPLLVNQQPSENSWANLASSLGPFWGREEKRPDTDCLRMHYQSPKIRVIVYFVGCIFLYSIQMYLWTFVKYTMYVSINFIVSRQFQDSRRFWVLFVIRSFLSQVRACKAERQAREVYFIPTKARMEITLYNFKPTRLCARSY